VTDRQHKLIRIVVTAVVACAVLSLAFLVALIQVRLRNGAVAQRLVASLEARFPKYQFQGGASYERAVVYIHVAGHVSDADREEIEGFLMCQTVKQGIAPKFQIWLWFEHDRDPEESHVVID
jgi:hypothetical protein